MLNLLWLLIEGVSISFIALALLRSGGMGAKFFVSFVLGVIFALGQSLHHGSGAAIMLIALGGLVVWQKFPSNLGRTTFQQLLGLVMLLLGEADCIYTYFNLAHPGVTEISLACGVAVGVFIEAVRVAFKFVDISNPD